MHHYYPYMNCTLYMSGVHMNVHAVCVCRCLIVLHYILELCLLEHVSPENFLKWEAWLI